MAAPPPEVDGPDPVEWWDDLLAAGADPGEDYVSPPIHPAESAPEIQSTPRDMSSVAPSSPTPGAAEVTLSDRGVAGRAGRTPVRLSAASGATVGETVRVEVLDRAAADRAGVRGFVFRLSGKAGAALPSDEELPATLTVDYSSFASRFGAGYADRLQVVALPDCAVANPVPADCDRTGTPLASRNDHDARRLVVTVDDLAEVQDPSAGGGGVVLALMAGPEGEGGSFKATPLSVTGDWQVGLGSGEFSWNYDIPVPAAVAGPTPEVNLSYSSGAVDGMVASRNSQAGPAGLGWSDFADSFIERRYNGCPNEGETYGDLCWASDNAWISLNGQSSELIKSPSDPNAWALKADPRWRVQRLFHPNPSDPNASNGDNDGEYWKVTTPDGTQYWFGVHIGPTAGGTGWHTNSTWTVPVVGNDSGEPCFPDAFHLCRQAWRWNLDWAIDSNGNMQTFLYEPELDNYAAVNGSDEGYVRAGYLTDIYYSRRSDDVSVQPARVTFASNYRCATLDAPGTDPCVAPHLANWDQSLYPDVPLDLHCDSNCTQTSPTFWSTKRYTQVDVCVEGAHEGNCALIDSVKLTHSLQDADGDTGTTEDTKLFLTGLQRTGYEPGPPGTDPAPDASLTLPPTTFTPVALENRHAPGGGESHMWHFRIASVKDEFGRQVDVTYDQPDPCPNPIPAEPQWDQNTKNCFPQLWAPEGQTPTFRAFNKYLVTQVEVNDTTGGSPSMVTDYLYGDQINTAGGAPQTWDRSRDQAEGVWHHDDDPYLAQANQSWSEWRGYQDVLVKQAETRTRYKLFRGMDDDQFQNPPPGGFRNVTISSLDGTVTNTPDSNWLAGRVLDEMALRSDGTPETGTVHGYQAVPTVNVPCSPTPCTDPPDDPHDARWVAENDTTVRRRTPAAGTVFRRQRTQTTYNALLLFPEQVIEHGWTDITGDERCTRTEYVINFTAFLIDFPQRVTGYDNGTTCTGTAITTRSETAYDGGAVGAAPVKGNPTTSRAQISTSPSPAGTWATTTTTFDALGRPHVVTDPNGHDTTTTYNGNSDIAGYPYEVKVANGLGQETETRLFLVRQVPAWSEDANDKRTTFAYDPLARVTSVWQPTESTSGPASLQFSYDIDAERDEVPVIRTRQLQDTAGAGGAARYLDTWVLYDSLLRERQTHVPSPEAGKVIVSDTVYDNRGLVASKNVPEAVTAAGGSALVTTPANGWRNRTQNFYDHVGRVGLEIFWADDTDADQLANNAQRFTGTTYTHETTEVDPIVGGNTRTKTDGLGRTIEVTEHDGTAYRTTTYGYDKADRLLTVTDPANNTITYTYDTAGRRLTMDDPDAGDWSYTYDPAGNQTSVTDALSAAVYTNYDELNRPIERREDDPTTGQLLASWTYDATGELGLLDKSTRVTPAGDWVVDIGGYDARNRPMGRSWTIPAGITGLAGGTPATFGPISYGYDKADHPTTVGYPAVGGLAAETVTTSYDDIGLPDTMTGAADYVSVTAYDNRARPALFGFGSSSALAMGKTWAYDLNQQLQGMGASATGGALTQSRTIAYDLAGNVSERNTTLSGASFKECFGYDARNRLTTAYTTTAATTCASGSNKGQGANPYNHTYGYTVDGNLASRTEDATLIDYTYPAAGSARPHAPTDVGANDYTWDANGNQATRTIGGQTDTLIWDTEHRLATVDDPGGDSSFVYDADGTRLLRQTPTGTTLYIEGHEITAPAGGGATTAVRSYGFGGQPVATRAAGGVDYIVTDNQGSVEQTIPAGSTTAEHTRTYFPYGKLRTGGQPDTDHTWLGQIEDDTTGFNYLNARYYDPTTALFIAPDVLYEVAQPKSLNPYAYAWGSPASGSDPSGLYMAELGGSTQCNANYQNTCTSQGSNGPPGNNAGAPSSLTSGGRNKAAIEGEAAYPSEREALRQYGLWYFGDEREPFEGVNDPCNNLSVAQDSACLDAWAFLHQGGSLWGAIRVYYERIGVYETDIDGLLAALMVGAVAGALDPRSPAAEATMPTELAGFKPPALPPARQVTAEWGPARQYAHGPGEMTAIEHINYRHAFNSGFDNVSRFAEGTSARQIRGYVDEALRYGNVTQGGASIRYDLGRTVGYDQAGNPVTGIQVWVRNDFIQTAYPVAP